MIKRIWAFFTGGKLVWLKDMDGQITLAIARKDPWGEMRAERYWPFRIRNVRLMPDGTVEGSYVRFWIDA